MSRVEGLHLRDLRFDKVGGLPQFGVVPGPNKIVDEDVAWKRCVPFRTLPSNAKHRGLWKNGLLVLKRREKWSDLLEMA